MKTFTTEDVTDEMVEAIDDAVSMGAGAWDMVDPKELTAAAWNLKPDES